MPRGRPTTKKKEFNIRVRIDEGTKRLIETAANGRTLSEYVRESVYRSLSGDLGNPSQELSSGTQESASEESVDFSPELHGAGCFVGQSTTGEELKESMLNLDDFLKVCEEAGKDPQSVIDYMVSSIWRL